MNNTPITPIKTRYLDTVTLQLLLDSGEYANAREAARAAKLKLFFCI